MFRPCLLCAASLDLPYVYGTHGQLKGPNLLKDSGSFAMSEVSDYMRGDIGGMLSGAMSFGKKAMGGSKYQDMARQQFTSPADVIEWAGCKDDQTSADASMGGQAQGAMSWAMLTSLSTSLKLLCFLTDCPDGLISKIPSIGLSPFDWTNPVNSQDARSLTDLPAASRGDPGRTRHFVFAKASNVVVRRSSPCSDLPLGL